MRIEKEVIRPGTYWYEDPVTLQPRKAVITPESVRYYHDQGKAMIASGLSIPVPLEHQKIGPMTAAEKAAANLANNAGWVSDYKLKKIKDDAGQEIEALFSDTEILDPKIAEKLPRTIRWTSPYISSFTDGNGKAWNGVISHLALTTRPRIVKQQPFPSFAAAMSMAASLKDEAVPASAKGVTLSRAGLLRRLGDSFSPVYPVAFSLWSGIGFASDMPPMKEKKKEPKEGEHEEHEEEHEGLENLEEDVEESLIDGDGDISIYVVTADLLDALGVPMEPSTGENFLHNLYKAVMSKVKGEDMANPQTMNTDNTPTQGNKTNTVQEAPPLYMSLEDAQKIADPTMRSIALSNVRLQQQIDAHSKRQEALEKNAVEAAGRHRQARIDRLMKKLSPAAKTRLQTELSGAKFSLGDDGVVKDSLDAMLSMLEDSVPDLPELLTKDVSSFSVQPHPRQYDGQMTEERRKEVVAEACRNGAIRTPAYHPDAVKK